MTTFNYSTDNATWSPAASPDVGSGVYSFLTTTSLTTGVYKMYVQNAADTTQAGVSAPFAVIPASPVALPTIANHVLSIEPDVGLSNLYVDSALTTQAVIGNAIGGIKDSTGTGNNFLAIAAQVPPVASPTFVASVKNSLPSIRFTAANSDLARISGGGTSAALLPPLLQASIGWTLAVFATFPTLPASGNNFEILQICTTVASYRLRLFISSSGIVGARLYDDAGNIVAQPLAVTGITAGATTSIILGYDGTKMNLTVNTQTNVQSTPSATDESTAWQDMWLGADRTGSATWSNYADMNLLGLEVWNTAFSTANAGALATYATSKWGA